MGMERPHNERVPVIADVKQRYNDKVLSPEDFPVAENFLTLTVFSDTGGSFQMC